jgi:hypothetical protein
MRLPLSKSQSGASLVLTLVICLTLGTILASYLTLIGSRYRLTLRSQKWNAAVAVLEAGIEEALTHLRKDAGNPSANGWNIGEIGGQQVYTKQRNLPDGSFFLVNLYQADTNNPRIYATGFVPAPLDPGQYISRTVRVTGMNPPLFAFAFAAIGAIQMNGTGLATDSFNSNTNTLSTNGLFDKTKTSTNGNVASVYGPVNFGNHTIKGTLSLGPTATNITVDPGQVLGGVFTDFNVYFPDVTLPDTTWVPATTTTIAGTPTHRFTTSGDYSIADNSNIQVEPGVSVRVRLDSNSFDPATVRILSTNGISGSLTVYQVSGAAYLKGNWEVQSGRARNFYYYGLPGVTSVTFDGTSSFVGVIYAPEADFTLNGGGNNVGMIGSCLMKSITMNGHYDFHYDEDLKNSGPTRSFIVTSWREL